MPKPPPSPSKRTRSRLGGVHCAGCIAWSATIGTFVTLMAGVPAEARDILRPGSSGKGKPGRTARSEAGVTDVAAAAQAKAFTRDSLARTTRAVQSIRAAQAGARAAALAGPRNLGLTPGQRTAVLPDVPNGLVIGGLQVAPGVPRILSRPIAGEDSKLWTGAGLPSQGTVNGRTQVIIKQNTPQAVLNWKTFNVGKNTTLQFDQTAGGKRSGEWIAFNKVNDPAARPSQILGNIEADGQVYVINRNGIIFGGSSQINTRGFVASSLPINDNLIAKGLLNNRDAQFLFSALPVPGGSDGTPAFNPTISDPTFSLAGDASTYTLAEPVAVSTLGTPLRTPEFVARANTPTQAKLVAGTDYTVAVDPVTKRATATFTPTGLAKTAGSEITATYTPPVIRTGDIVVQRGAILRSPVSADGNGGRVMLVGTNVRNEGTISTPAGQAIIAAGQQVAIAAHASNDPSLRGLDVWVGAAPKGTGTATNTGLIESLTGSASMHGRTVDQLGAIESSTSVDLNGRIDLKASYGAVSNPNFDNDGIGGGAPPFLFSQTGAVTFGSGSSTRILPDYASLKTVPGVRLPERSRINVEGLAIHLAPDALMLAPNADVNFRAGVWAYKDPDGNGTIFNPAGETEVRLSSTYAGGEQRFVFSSGQIYLDRAALIDVSGSTGVLVPLSQSILNVEFRGAEFADSPLQRDGVLRAIPLTVDIRRTGISNGRFWMGTPLGDATGLTGLIQRNAAQLTAEGGNITLQAGGSVVVRDGARIDVSGGFFQHEGGMVQTTRLMQDGRLIDIANAQPNRTYDGVYTGKFTTVSAKWGVTETFTTPFMSGRRFEQGYVEGAAGGDLVIVAPSMAIDGDLRGATIQGVRERALPPEYASLSLRFAAETTFEGNPTLISFLPTSPTPPEVVFSRENFQAAPDVFQLVGEQPGTLHADRTSLVILSPDLVGPEAFGELRVENTSGTITVPADITLAAPALGTITLAGSNVTVLGSVAAPGGTLEFLANSITPAFAAAFPLLNPTGAAAPAPVPGRGQFTLGAGATLSAAGLLVDDRPGSTAALSLPVVTDGGSVSIRSYSAVLEGGSTIDVSGGVLADARGTLNYGDGGAITIRTGRDPALATVLGGSLELGSTLLGFSGDRGASLTIQASLIQIGGATAAANTLLLAPDFFRRGGFTSYNLEGIGAASRSSTLPGGADPYIAGINIAPGTRIEPVAESLLAVPNEPGADGLVLRPILKEAGQRAPTSISFTAKGGDDPFTIERLEVRGDIVMGLGASIVTDPGGAVTFDGNTVALFGSVTAPGGSITVRGANRFPLRGAAAVAAQFARATVYLASSAKLSTAGTAIFTPDSFGRRTGTLLPGGRISVAGNIVAEAGAVLDVSGASTTFDVHPMMLGGIQTVRVPLNSGISAPLWRLETVPVQVDSNGGAIDLQGGEMLASDATLLGRPGGPSALGGSLSVFSGRFYVDGSGLTSADINLVVTQSGTALPAGGAPRGVGFTIGSTPAMGYFAADRFTAGEFHSLDLGAKYLETGGPLPFGGNVEFRGPVSIAARGALRVAGGGVIQANAPVSLSGGYVVIGQAFRAPTAPGDEFSPFTRLPAIPSSEFNFSPTSGLGSLTIQGGIIDAGTLSLQGISQASLVADGGDIRGSGTFNIAGDLTLRAAQIYPVTASDFTITAFDRNIVVASAASGSKAVTLASASLPPGFKVGTPFLGSTVESITGNNVTLAAGANATVSTRTPIPFAPGSVSIVGSGNTAPPLSAGGRLSIYASRISQGGTLRAPLGSIVIGWDGTDTNLADADIDPPLNPIARTTQAVPVSRSVTLRAGSITSVSGIDPATGEGILFPFGLSPDGLSWIDPRGQNVTVNGLPQKSVSIAGVNVTTEAGSAIDIRGGGDLYAFRFTPGNGGSIDILGTASGPWNGGTEYQPGDLVAFGGQTFSARVRSTGETPKIGLFWSRVAESFAVLPGFDSRLAPFAPFNTGPNATNLAGEAGFVSTSVRAGDRIFLEQGGGLAEGSYTLLPRRYALLPGAFLVTPSSGEPLGTATLEEGGSFVSGYRFTGFGEPERLATLRSRYEVADPEIIRLRATYDDFTGNEFFTEAASRLDVASRQRLAIDAGSAAFHGNVGLRLLGDVQTSRPGKGRGASIDVSSFADIYVLGGPGTAPAGATAVLNAAVLNSWGAESLLVGGLRRQSGGGTVLDVRTKNLVINTPGTGLLGPEITLASRERLTISAGSSILSTGSLSEPSTALGIVGDGTLIRVSGDPLATTSRTNVTGSQAPLLTVGAGVRIGGTSVQLDSTYGTQLDPSLDLTAEALALGSGQISILLDTPANGLTGSVVTPHLTLAGQFLRDVQQVRQLTLRSYRTIDLYGDGTFGSAKLGSLTLLASGVRGYDQGDGTATVRAGRVRLSNPSNAIALPAPAVASGTLNLQASLITLGRNAFSVAGYNDVDLDARGGLLGVGKGTLRTAGNLTITTPIIAGAQGAKQEITAGGDILLQSNGRRTAVRSGLGASFQFTGASIVANTAIVLPSGQITLQATTADVTVGGKLDVSGTTKRFFDLVRFSDAGTITLASTQGDVVLAPKSVASVAAAGLGDAGVVAVRAAQGSFTSAGAILRGSARAGADAGSFLLDVGMLPSFVDISTALNGGGFTNERNLRVRTGDVEISNVNGQANVARTFTVSADQGDIRVTGTIDVSGRTGGKIVLAAGGDLVLAPSAILTAHAEEFTNAGKGGEIRLEAAGADTGAMLDLQAGSTINLGVDAFLAGEYATPGSSAFFGQFTGKLHLRAPRTGNDVNVSPLRSSIVGASSVVVEGYQVYDRTGVGTLDIALRSQINADSAAFMDGGYDAMQARLLSGNADAASLAPLLVIAPGVEIINRTGNLALGTANNANGTATSLSSADWDLSSFRYGPRRAAGILTLRASGDLVFNNTLSDGFTPVGATATNGHSNMWAAQLMNINPDLPVNTQSWSYRLAAGSDLAAADFRAVVPSAGSLFVGEFYSAIPNSSANGDAAIGSNGLTANTIRISQDGTNRGTRFEVVRTGTGDIDIAAGTDVQLRNQFSTIYTAGVRLPDPTTIYQAGDFIRPNIGSSVVQPDGGNLGASQRIYNAQWSMAGGDLRISAGADIGRFTFADGQVVADSSRQFPNNWLHRRGFVDPLTGLFAQGGVDGDVVITDLSASTAWWVDFSVFFQGFGALGGGDVSLLAGSDLINADAVIPTNARMPGRDPLLAINLAPDSSKLVELGGGDLIAQAGANIDGGMFYVQSGTGTLFAGESITTNSTRSPSLGRLGSSNLPPSLIQSVSPEVFDPLTWLPTTLFAGATQFDVSARGNILLGPTTNPYLLPQGLNNKFWYKTTFNTFSPEASVDVQSIGGSVTHRLSVTLPGANSAQPILNAWLGSQNVFNGIESTGRASFYQPWLRLSELGTGNYGTLFSVSAPTLRSTAFAGNVNVVGDLTLFPSPTGTLEIAASGEISGLQPSGRSQVFVNGEVKNTIVFASAAVNISDADPDAVPGVGSPLAYSAFAGRDLIPLRSSEVVATAAINTMFRETGSYTGQAGAVEVQQALHAANLLHAGDREPVRLHALGGDITAITLFSPKAARIIASNDITDVAFYIQHVSSSDISLVSAGRDVVPFNENAPVRSLAGDLSQGNFIGSTLRTTVTGVQTNALAGDIQINGPGAIEVIAGRNLDLGTGANFIDGTGVGLTSVGNARNPFLPLNGASIIALAGVGGPDNMGPALGLSQSSLSFDSVMGSTGSLSVSEYGAALSASVAAGTLTEEQEAIISLELFFDTLRDSGRAASLTGDYAGGMAAIAALVGTDANDGEILTRARDIRTVAEGAITLLAPGGGVTLASDITGSPLIPPGVVTEAGGSVSVFARDSVDIGRARIFTLRGGDITIWSSTGNIAAGTAPKTVVTAPPTRVLIDSRSAAVKTDLGGLATGGGIGVLASVQGVPPGDVDLIAPSGFVDAGDAGIRVTGNLNIAAIAIVNAGNIQVGGATSGVSAASPVAAPNIGALTSASNAAGAAASASTGSGAARKEEEEKEEPASVIVVEVLGYSEG